MLALHGQGRYDRFPAGDLHLLKIAGRELHGHPRARATEEEVRELFAPYGPWAGLASAHALAGGPAVRASRPRSPRPRPGGTRSSAPAARRRAA